VARALRILFITVFIGYVLSLASVYFSYIEPYLFPLRLIQGSAREINERIIIGPYPHLSDIEKLVKVNGVEVVISLLNPSLPFEESLLRKEKEILSKMGIRFYNVPFSFISLNSKENERAVEKVRRILSRERGKKVYIHCYLGRHRVGFLVEKLLRK